MAWQLTYRATETVPVEVEKLLPETLAALTAAQIGKLPVLVGNRTAHVDDLFEVQQVDGDDLLLVFCGELTGVHWIGTEMTRGEIHVRGPAGRHVGSGLSGGSIEVFGDAGDWVGAEMKGGSIRVRGDGGHLVGAAYRGSRRGMTGGRIVIDGKVGNEIGHTMRRGLIAVGGDTGDLIGFNMLAGTILTFGQVGIRHGAGMRRGTLGFLGREAPPLLPTFRYACRFRPLALAMILRDLQKLGWEIDPELFRQDVTLYNGDFLEGGRGELLLATPL